MSDKPKLTATRIAIWIAVAAVGLYLVISGIVGILAKG
jgi:ABC-type dipeptide/oligopeptide/nickel transport system permease subunit